MASRIALRPPAAADAREFAAAVLASRELHRPWITAPTTPEAFRAWRKRLAQSANCALLACRRDTGQIVGVFDITSMVMGPFRSAFLGYYVFAGHQHQGLMAEGLRAVVRHAFQVLKLHRLEANIQPANTPTRHRSPWLEAAASCSRATRGTTSRSAADGATTSAGPSSLRDAAVLAQPARYGSQLKPG